MWPEDINEQCDIMVNGTPCNARQAADHRLKGIIGQKSFVSKLSQVLWAEMFVASPILFLAPWAAIVYLLARIAAILTGQFCLLLADRAPALRDIVVFKSLSFWTLHRRDHLDESVQECIALSTFL